MESLKGLVMESSLVIKKKKKKKREKDNVNEILQILGRFTFYSLLLL